MHVTVHHFSCQSKPHFDEPTPKSCRGHKGGSVGGKGSPKDPTRTHTHSPKRTRLGLNSLASEGAWGHVLAWLGIKFVQLIPLLVLYIHVTFRGNPRFVQ